MSIASKIVQLTQIRTAIRNALIAKGISASTHDYADFADDILRITSGGITPSGSINIVTNGTVDVTNYANAVVAVPTSGGNLQGKSVSFASNGTRIITPDSNYDGLSSVTIEVSVSETLRLETKEVTPGASDISVNPSSGYDGLSSVTVKAVNSNADANFVAGNIKKNVTIFGVTGTYEPSLTSLSVTPSGTQQTFTPGSGTDGYNSVVVAAAVLESKTVDPSSSDQTITPTSGNYGLSQVIVKGAPLQTLSGNNAIVPTTVDQQVTKTSSSWYGLFKVVVKGDANLVAANIANGVSIFGVAGTHSGVNNRPSVTVTPSRSQQTITPTSSYTGLSQVVVNETPLDAEIGVTPGTSNIVLNPTGNNIGLSKVTIYGDANLVAANIRSGVTIFDVQGTYTGGGAPINGSLIEISCSSNITQVTATVNGNTYTANLNTSTHKAYVTIPYTDTTAARTCVLNGYVSGAQATSANVSMSAGIGYYTASLSTSSVVYDTGTWTGVDSRTWTYLGGAYSASMTEAASYLRLDVEGKGSPVYQFGAGIMRLDPAISTRGYNSIEITVTQVGGIGGPWFYADDSPSVSGATLQSNGIVLSQGTNVFNIPAADQGKMLYLFFAGYAQADTNVYAAKITKIRFI